MKTLDIKETDVVELTDDNQLYFVVDVTEKARGYITVRDTEGDDWAMDASRVVNVWRHHL